jgi:hypothetical protein
VLGFALSSFFALHFISIHFTIRLSRFSI